MKKQDSMPPASNSPSIEPTTSTNPGPATSGSLFQRLPWGWLGLAVVLTTYTLYLLSHVSPAITGIDDNGYFAQGTVWANSGKTWFRAESDAQYIGHNWLVTPDGKFISRYPPGVSAVVAALYLLGGYTWASMTTPFLSIAALLGMFLLVKRLAGSGWAVAAIIILGTNPTFVLHALEDDAHMSVTCMVAWGLWLLLKWVDSTRWPWIFFAGLVFGCIPTFRYPDALMGLGVMVFLAWNWKQVHSLIGNRIYRHYLLAIAAAMIPLFPLLLRNQLLMGAFWRTGYALTNEQTGFSREFFCEHAIEYVRTLNACGIGFMPILGVLGMTWMICGRKTRALGLAMLLMTLPTLLLYMAYYWAPQTTSAYTMRFLLPTFVVYIAAGAWALRELTLAATSGGKALGIALPLVLVSLQLLWGTREMHEYAVDKAFHKEWQARVAAALYSMTEQGDVVVASKSFLHNLDFVGKWKLADQSLVNSGVNQLFGFKKERDPDDPFPSQAKKENLRKELYKGSIQECRGKFVHDVQEWAGAHRIYIVAAEAELPILTTMGGETKILQRVIMPDEPPKKELEVTEQPTLQQRARAARDNALLNGAERNGRRGINPTGGLGTKNEIVIAEWMLPTTL